MDLGSEVKGRMWDIGATSRSDLDLAQPLKDRFVRYWPWPYGKQQKVQVADHIAQMPAGRILRAAAEDEARRLLYVSMTRARDMLVFARSAKKPSGEWLDTLAAPWLLPEQGANALMLPDGTAIPYQHWELEPADAQPAAARAPRSLYWFSAAGDRTARMPLIVTPSSAEAVPCKPGERAQLGSRIPLQAGVEMQQVGSALHNCIAAALGSAGQPVSVAEIGDILAAWGLDGKIDPGQVLAQVDALRGWIAQRWPDASIHCEIPVEALRDNGQVLKGQVDLLLDTPNGWILIDHKANPRAGDAWEETAQRYSGQLKLYKDAIERATSRRVVETWLYFPVAAGAISGMDVATAPRAQALYTSLAPAPNRRRISDCETAMTPPDYELTAHAATVLAEREIPRAWLERVLTNPERTESDKADPQLQHAIGRISEYGDRHLRVIYNPKATPWRIVTVYFDRALRGKS